MYFPNSPEFEEVELWLPDGGFNGQGFLLTDFTEYSFNSHFLSPTDGFTFTIGEDPTNLEDIKKYVIPGAKVILRLNGTTQCTGYIDYVESTAGRDGGTVIRVGGRDCLSQAVDANADPTVSLKDGQTLTDALTTLFTPFGWSEEDQFEISDEADRDIRSNAFRARRKASQSKGNGKRAVKDYIVHENRPYPLEGVYEFATRLAKRFGLWIWSSANGKTLIVDTPDFDQEETFSLYRTYDGQCNVLDMACKFDQSKQFTAIVADSYAEGGEFGVGRAKIVIENSAVEVQSQDTPPWKKYVDKGAKFIRTKEFHNTAVMKVPVHRVGYFHDDESATAEHVENFARYKMAMMQQESLKVTATVEGHGQETDAGTLFWTPNLTVFVYDEVSGVDEMMWIMSRTFTKSRAGTHTQLELIRLNTLVFTDQGGQQKAAPAAKATPWRKDSFFTNKK